MIITLAVIMCIVHYKNIHAYVGGLYGSHCYVNGSEDKRIRYFVYGATPEECLANIKR